MKLSTHALSPVNRYVFVGICLVALLLSGCSPEFVKPKAQDQEALAKQLPAKDLLQTLQSGEQMIFPDPAWLSGIDSLKTLTFLGITNETDHIFGLLLKIDLETNQLHYIPLSMDENPLTILADSERAMALEKLVMMWSKGMELSPGTSIKTLPLEDLTKRLTSPIPRPGRIFAVAANYPSHLFFDLSLPEKKELITQLRKSRPRIFQKYPPVAAPGEPPAGQEVYAELPGPFGTLAAPTHVQVPSLDGENQSVSGHLDYEVEIAAMIGKDLSWDEVRKMDDQELHQTVVGYLLISDAKVRDPQAMGKIVREFKDDQVTLNNPYRIGNDALDGGLGTWDLRTCHWWSYAASWGRYASFGPFLATASVQDNFPPRMILSARSYTSAAERPVSPPKGVPTDRLLLRQAALTTVAPDHPDSLIWDIPAIIRSLLNPTGNALSFNNKSPALQAGDLIALGTPGGTVISAKPWWLLPIAENLLFWKTPDDFYKMFFKPSEGDYLHPGDELFLWGEGLGYQLLRIDKPRGQ